MVSVMVCGGLMARQGKAATGDTAFEKSKRVTVRYYLEHLVPEALGKAAAAKAGAALLYELDADTLAA
jgi:3-(methylthio)propanoyl-CoA dehydrogenase